MTIRMNASVRAIAVLALLATLAAAQAQPAPAPGPASPDTWRGVGREQEEKDAQRAREAERLRDEELRRREAERGRAPAGAAEKVSATPPAGQLLARLFQLPDTLTLTADHRALAEAVLSEQRNRAAAAWPSWQEQVQARIAAAGATEQELALQLSVRVLNEAALWFADAEPHPSDTVWIEALQREGLCRGLTGSGPAARMAALIEALPADRRAAAWAGEAARLARWGHESRTVLPPADRSLEDSLGAALRPPALAGTLGTLPLPLRAAVQAPGWDLAKQPPALRCELLRWWGQERVRLKQMGPRQAMLAWRSALAPRSAEFLLPDVPRSGPKATDAQGFPLAASRLGLSGRVVVQQNLDPAGVVLESYIQRRELRAAGLGKQPPIALEHELDQATLARVAALPVQAPDASTLLNGYATRRVGIEWATE